MAVLATIISALVGGLSGYLGSRLKTDTLTSTKRDDIARALAEADLRQMESLGVTSDYTPIAHYVVNRRILEDFDVSKESSLEELRDKAENAMGVCRNNRRVLMQILLAEQASQLSRATIQSMRDRIEKYCNHIANLPYTPEFNQYKNLLRLLARGEMVRLNALEGMSDGQGLNRSRDLLVEAIQREPNRVEEPLFEGE